MALTPTPPTSRTRAVDHLAVAIGTSAGLYFASDGYLDGPQLEPESVTAFLQVEGAYLVATTHERTGVRLRRSTDGAATWAEIDTSMLVDTATGTAVRELSQLQLDRRLGAPNSVLVGTDPAVLLEIDPGIGQFHQLAQFTGSAVIPAPDSLTAPVGGGVLGDAGSPEEDELAELEPVGRLHSILTHPGRPDRIVLGSTPGGVLISEDSGKTFATANSGLPVAPSRRAGTWSNGLQRLAVDAADPDLLYAQHRAGIFRSEDGGANWSNLTEIGTNLGLPSTYGTVVVTHPVEADVAYVFPLRSREFPYSTYGRAWVYRTAYRGQTWLPLTKGLPTSGAYLSIEPDAFTIGNESPYPLLFGTTSGELFASVDGGSQWRSVVRHLPPIHCVTLLNSD